MNNLKLRLAEMTRDFSSKSKPGDEIGLVTHGITSISGLKQDIMFDENGELTEYGEKIQKKYLKLEGTGVYESSIFSEYVDSTITNQLTRTEVFVVDEEASKRFADNIKKSGPMNKESWVKFEKDYLNQGRKWQELCIDGKHTDVKQKDVLIKYPTTLSGNVSACTNHKSFIDNVVYGNSTSDDKIKISFSEIVEDYLAGEYSEDICYDVFGDTKIEAINKIADVMNTIVKDTILDAKEISREENINIGNDIIDLYNDFIGELSSISGYSFDRLSGLADRSLYRIQSIINNVFNIDKISSEIKISVISAIETEIYSIISQINKQLEKDGDETTINIVDSIDEADDDSVVVDIKTVMYFGFMSLERSFYLRGGSLGIEDYFKGNRSSGNLNINPFAVKKGNKNRTEKGLDYSLTRIYKIFGGLISLLFKDDIDLSNEEWNEFGIVDGKIPSYSKTYGKYKIAVLDAVRDKEGKIVDMSDLVRVGSYMDENNKKGYSKEFIDFINKVDENFSEEKEKRETLDIAGLIGKTVKNCISGSISLDKNKVPSAEYFNVYTEDGTFIGTTGNYKVSGTVAAVFKNVLLIEE